MDRFQAMRLFVAVAEQASFVKAAEILQLSPPAVTRSIAALESRLGARLLVRTTRRVRLTEVGTQYLADCQRILADLAEAEESAAGLHQALRGRLHVTAPVLFGQLYVLPALLDFLDLHPGLDGRTLFVDRVVNMQEEGLDVAVRLGDLPDSSLIALKVGQVRRVFCAAPDYLRRRGSPGSLAQLKKHRLVLTSNLDPAGLKASLVVNTNAAAITAALAGWGITRVLSYQVAQEVASGRLQILLEELQPDPWPIYILHQEGQRVSAKVRAFVDFLSQRLPTLLE